MKFTLKESSLVTFYAEVPKNLMHLSMMVSKDNGTFKRKVKSSDLNKDLDNFLKSSEYKHVNIV